MDAITSAREIFTDYRLRHPVATTVLAVTAVLGVLVTLRRNRRDHSTLANLVWFWPVKFMVYATVASLVFTAAAVYLAPRGYRWARAKWEARA